MPNAWADPANTATKAHACQQPQEDAGVMYADYLAELTRAGETVWEWRSWEHLDPVADGIAEAQALRTLWAMGNSILELPNGDILAVTGPLQPSSASIARPAMSSGNSVLRCSPVSTRRRH